DRLTYPEYTTKRHPVEGPVHDRLVMPPAQRRLPLYRHRVPVHHHRRGHRADRRLLPHHTTPPGRPRRPRAPATAPTAEAMTTPDGSRSFRLPATLASRAGRLVRSDVQF